MMTWHLLPGLDKLRKRHSASVARSRRTTPRLCVTTTTAAVDADEPFAKLAALLLTEGLTTVDEVTSVVSIETDRIDPFLKLTFGLSASCC